MCGRASHRGERERGLHARLLDGHSHLGLHRTLSTTNDVGDEDLQPLLRRAIEATDPAPAQVGAFAIAAFGWRNADSSLAERADSTRDEESPDGRTPFR